MTKIYTIKFSKFLKWLAAQPDERPVVMNRAFWTDNEGGCGCVMVEYARDNYKKVTFASAGIYSLTLTKGKSRIRNNYDFEHPVFCKEIKDARNMGEIKRHFGV